MELHGKDLDDFQANGVLIIRNILPPSTIDECLNAVIQFDAYDEAIKQHNAIFDHDSQGTQYLKYFQHINFYIPSFWKIINSRIFKMAATLLNQEVYYYNLGLHDKAPYGGTHTPFHQDNYYWCLAPADALTAYIPLEKQDAENGGIEYLPGSHKAGTLQHSRSKTKAFSSQIENVDLSKWQKLNPQLNPGDVAFHHCNLIHGAKANNSGRHRRALAMSIYGEKSQVSEEMLKAYRDNLVFNREGKISANIRIAT